ncbi:E3 ubiquitin-protein ligase RSL1-like [Rosa sericea]
MEDPIMDDRRDAEDLQAILAEQRRELLAVRTLDSDLDMAFNLQMKEALTASLALQPSSSTQQSPPPSPPYEPSDDLLDLAAAFMLEDVERFPQEYEDHERSVLEVKKLKTDLDRRIHDQKFAIEVRDLPESYWSEYGDEYERPYCTDGSSSSKDGLQTECLRLYCKGLISEEVVKNVKVAMGGIGVAICDPRDNLIFEAKKNLEVLIDGEIMSNEAAELEALCEGLNKALTLDLKNITFFIDDNKLYQYVADKVIPGNSKIATLVNQVALLQRKFESCSPSLVAPSEIKFVFKFARDAIVSQISWSVKTLNGKSFKETCAICFEETDVARMFSIDGCLHRYCISCMKKHVEVKLLGGMVAQCPHEACNSEVNIDSYEQFLAPNLVAVMSQRIKESSIPVTERVYCPYPKCSALMSKKEVFEYTKTSYVSAESAARKCMKCHYYFCFDCMVPWHYKMSCEEYKQSHPFPLKEDQLLNSLATTKQWRNCKKCNHMVELAEGCNHITCRCGYEFCYTCGAEWKNKKPTCSCPLWDERRIYNT